MNMLFNICGAVSLGVFIGFACGLVKSVVKKSYTEKQSRRARKLIERVSFLLKYITFLLLTLGLIWCVYFLVLGIFCPEQVDYANNMAELIVAVLSVISVIFGFVEFIKRDHQERDK